MGIVSSQVHPREDDSMPRERHSPIGPSRKLNLLLQRSFRYSYRQRCCQCCPTILCELLFPLLLMTLIALTRYGTNAAIKEINKDPRSSFNRPRCSQDDNTSLTSSNDILAKCFQFPPRYKNVKSSFNASGKTNMIFQPMTADTEQLVQHARLRLAQMNCTDTQIWTENITNGMDDTVTIDFGSGGGLKNSRNLAYNIIVRMPNGITKNDPIDLSFTWFSHPALIADRSNAMNMNNQEGSQMPEFSDVKIFIDSLLVSYQMNRTIEWEIERGLMRCTPHRRDVLFESGSSMIITVLIWIDVIFLIPYLILLTGLIREKNAKVKEILKILGIEPVLNNLAHAIRTEILLCFLTLLLCVIFKSKMQPDAYFNTVNFGILFFSYFIFNLQLISFCIMNAQLYDKNVRAIVGTIFIYILSLILFSNMTQWPVAIQYILIFLSPSIAGYSLFQQMVLHDLAERDVAFFQTIYRYVPMYFPTLIIMMFSCLFYWLLSWYLEKVFPGEYGTPIGWNFLFQRDYWHSEKVDPTEIIAVRNSINQPIVHVDHLVKKFGPDKIAVNDVSFDLYENQITSLLGPNGSGKTTIFNCLIGIYRQTSGAIIIKDDDGRQSKTGLRRSMGYCPQYDILFDLLTIQEQIEFYATARGFGKSKEAIANDLLRLVSLEGSKNLYCNSLSGGMKRRLSLACAFVGDTKIILLDEPSSGLDPSNRRLLWDWLRSMKQGKTLLLTTHFMEESDALSDRIMIISNGTIKADGTSAKLKEQYGSGYKLVINKQTGYPTKDLKGVLNQYLPGLTIESDIAAGDVVFRTNQQPNEHFVQALQQLEIMKNENRIKNYGVQNSTMDDVFLRITGKESQSASMDTDTIGEQCRKVFNNREFDTGIRYYFGQCRGLMIKTVLVHYRRWALTLIVLLVPILYNLLSNLISQSQNANGIYKMNINSLNPQTILYNTDPMMEKFFQASINGATLKYGSGNISDINQEIWEKRNDRLFTYTDIYLAFHAPKPAGDIYTIQALSSNLISGHEAVALASNLFYKYASNDTSASIQTTLIYKNIGNSTVQVTIGDILNYLSAQSCSLKFIPTSLLLDVFVFYILFFYTTVFLISERKDRFLSLLNISGLHPASYWLFNYLCDLIISIVWFCYLLAIYCLFDAAFNGLPTDKTRSDSMSNFQFAAPWDLRVQFYPLTILIVLPTLPFAYLCTKLFRSDILGGITICFILIILHFISIIVPAVALLIKSTSVQTFLYWLCNIVSPSINAQALITYILAQKSEFCQVQETKPVGDDTIGWNMALLVLHTLLLLVLLIGIDSGLLQLAWSSLDEVNFNENALDADVLAERRRVLALATTAGGDEENNIDHLTVKNLVKYYPRRKVLAVDHLTFGAKRGEAFGLLGYNGAGKTTTFRIIIGELKSTQGTAVIDGQNVQRRIRSTRHLGYCPQENCSMDFLTVEDSLYLLARLRGVKAANIQSIVQTMSALFLLDPFSKNYIHQLSGGTKRRLHAAIALIGPPLVAILDEPTTGVDPNARQQMQEIFLNAIKAKLTIILTSHSMDECERVCNRLGIMVRGQLACLGTIQHLKSKFGQGYTVEIKVRSIPNEINATAIQNVQTFLLSQSRFRVEVKETTHSTGSFQIEQSTPAELFQLLEENKERLNIETYTISQTTLEQIFLSFGKQIRVNS